MRGIRSVLTSPIAVGFGLAFVALALPLVVPAAVSGQGREDNEDEEFLRAKGRVTYRVYCINCHGPKGKGDGEIAQYLTVDPTDLTQLKKNNEGKFSSEKVRAAIDGTTQVRGHGRKEMPVWGDVFATSPAREYYREELSGEERAEQKIHELVVYLKSIQEVE